MNSNIPSKSAYGVYVYSQLVRIGRICDEYADFVKRLTIRLIISKYRDIFNKFNVTLKQHIKEGIALPLCNRSTLSRLVTVRNI